jgi:predicted metal-dependent peptidase
VLEPQIDPETGREDVPSDGEYKESIAKAAAAAKAMGKMPGHLQKMVDEILSPQISWREHLRLLVVGRIGNRRESWERPNRRRLALGRGDPAKTVVLPGRRGTGADNLAVILDSSGSIYSDKKLLSMFFAELQGIVADTRPRKVWVIHCDAEVQRVDEVRSLLEVEDVRVRGTIGGGGTDFRPPFSELAERGIVPDTLVYLTDGFGAVDKDPPNYPVIWAVTKGGQEQPWGEHVWIETN